MLNKNSSYKCGLPTIKEVANTAGVSSKTVSRVINGEEHVRKQTRQKVLDAIQMLGYQPNAIARSLRVKNTYTIGVVIADITNNFFGSIVRGIEDVAAKNNYSVIIANSDEEINKEIKYVQIFREKQVEGIIIAPAIGSHKYLESLANHKPIVFIDRYPEDMKASIVKVDNEGGSYKLTEHLINHGYQRIAFIGSNFNLTTARERFNGFQKAMQEKDLEVNPDLIKTGNKTIQDAFRSTIEVLEQPQRPQAIFASSNFMTIGVLQALNQVGFEIPKDIAVVGFDDYEMADICQPRLTVVSQPSYTLGYEAANLLFNKIKTKSGRSDFEDIILPVGLIIRESCGCK